MNRLEKQPAERLKRLIAEEAVRNNHFSSAQVRELLSVFEFENSRLLLAKGAYSKTVDPYNYYVIFDQFEYQSSIYELKKQFG